MAQASNKSGGMDHSDLKLINKKSILCYSIISAVLSVCYIVELMKQSRELGYVVLLLAILWGTFAICETIYKINPNSQRIKEVILVGFGIFYTIALFTGVSSFVFAYAFPLLIVSTVYRDVKHSIISGICTIGVNIVYIVVQFIQNNVTKQDIVDYEIQLAVFTLAAFFMVIIAKLTNELFQLKLEQIHKEKENQSIVLKQVVNVAKTVSEKINEISNEARQIKEQSTHEQNAIEQIASGTSEVANNIQNQLLMSNNITELTDETSCIVTDILNQFNSTKENTSTGSTNMEELMRASVTSQHTCDTVSNAMNELSKKISEVEAILGLIEGVTKQTSLLSLNASIEAARAGNAGRGFSVVALNIQQLSEETKQATEEIKKIIDMLGESSQVAMNAVNELELANDVQTRLITKSKENFEVIEKDILHITEKVNKQSQHMNKVKDSNGEISVSIENVSAFTEELTASAEDTKNLTQENLKGIHRVNLHLEDVVNQLKDLEGLI